MNLHNHQTIFVELIQATAQALALPEVYVEKDYWVTKALKHLSESPVADQVVFKGGTSLSKAHRIIDRFSEDIDLAAIATELSDQARKTLLKNAAQVTAQELELLSDDPRTSKGSKFRKAAYRYPRVTNQQNFGQATPELLIEVNTFTDPEPANVMRLQSMIAEILSKNNKTELINTYELQPFSIKVLSVKRTLIEKMLGVIKDSYAENPVTQISTRIRHLYDISMILRHDEHRNFVNSQEFHELCRRCIVCEKASWRPEAVAYLDKPLANAPVFSQLDVWWPQLEIIYRTDFADLAYGALPNGKEISEALHFLKTALSTIR